MTKRFCLLTNSMVDENCSNKNCPLAPCNFNTFVSSLTEMFRQKGFCGKDSRRMSRKIVLDCFTDNK
jgi:hypothetical protein